MLFARLIAVPALLLAMPAFAQSSGPPADAPINVDGDRITVGVAGVYLPDYEGSKDHVLRPAPGAIGSVSGFEFTVAGNRASLDLIPKGPGPGWNIQAGPIAVLDLNRSNLKQIGDLRVRALGRRSASIEVGGFVGVGKTGVITSPYDTLSVSISYRKGVTGAQRAGVLSPTINYFTPLSRKAAIGLFASAERAERGYANTYFDVDAAGSAASGLPVFSTRGGWKSYTLGALGGYSLTGDLTHGLKLAGGVTYARMLNDFAESPIVSIAGNKNQWTGLLGLAYTF